MRLREVEKAIAFYDRAIEIKPDFHEAWNNRGNALIRLGRYEDAINSHQQALAINPNHANAYYNLACAYALQQNLPLALKNLQQAITLDPQNQDIAKTDNDFDPIRKNPQFLSLLQTSSNSSDIIETES